tara:strand:- start:6370 stop:6633 length:264 start_codon:yes stop_codon:yes gene_type:complete
MEYTQNIGHKDCLRLSLSHIRKINCKTQLPITNGLSSGKQTMINDNNDQVKPNRNSIIENAILPTRNGTTMGMSIAMVLATKQRNVV